MPLLALPLRLSRWIVLAAAAAATGPAPTPSDTAVALRSEQAPRGVVWLDDVDLSDSPDTFVARRSLKNTPIQIAGLRYAHGLGGGGRARLRLNLDGQAKRFQAVVGIDDAEKSDGSLAFELWLDDRKVRDTGRMKKGEAHLFDVDVTGVELFELVVRHGGESTDWERFGLGGARFVMTQERVDPPRLALLAPEPTASIALLEPEAPTVNGPVVIGGTPGRPFLYRLPVTGRPPLRTIIKGLPAGLTFAADTGVISGVVPAEGRYSLVVTVQGPRARTSRTLTLIASTEPAALAPTPPMGWSSWNAFGMNVDAAKVKAAAEALITSGLAAHGYRTINIDDGWMGARDRNGVLRPAASFGDVEDVARFVHARGLKLGIYSSPGRETCGKRPGSYQHEDLDARTWAEWGVDYLKYDWCSYDAIAPDRSLPELRRPYEVMRAALDKTSRDVVFSLCQYGRGDVWTWGRQVGGQLWRTTSDITDTWTSLEGIAFDQAGKEGFAGPGGFNDPDMLVVGQLGWGESPHASRLAGNEQILHLTHWSMLAAPLIVGCDLTKLDPFTLALLTNDEVIAIDQDPLVRAATRVAAGERTEVWTRPLADGTRAVALYNRGPRHRQVEVSWALLGLEGSQPVRDVWLRRDLGKVNKTFVADVPQHGAVLIRVGTPRRAALKAP